MLSHILNQIEVIRNQLNDLADKKELTHPEVVRLSQELDKILNKYHLLLQTIKKEE